MRLEFYTNFTWNVAVYLSLQPTSAWKIETDNLFRRLFKYVGNNVS